MTVWQSGQPHAGSALPDECGCNRPIKNFFDTPMGGVLTPLTPLGTPLDFTQIGPQWLPKTCFGRIIEDGHAYHISTYQLNWCNDMLNCFLIHLLTYLLTYLTISWAFRALILGSTFCPFWARILDKALEYSAQPYWRVLQSAYNEQRRFDNEWLTTTTTTIN